MAMARSLAHLFFLLLAVVSTASAARDLHPDAAATDNNSLDEACEETRFPDLCARSLLAFPDSRTASPRRLAELSVLAALDAGRAAAEFVHDVLNSVVNNVVNDDDGLLGCLDSCSADVEEAVAHLSALSREPTDSRFLFVKAWLSATLDGSTAAAYEAAACKDAPGSEVKDAAVARSVEFDMMLHVALDLITEASASMSPDPIGLPPSEQDAASPAYGGAAFGGGSPYGAPAPKYGGGARRGKPRAAPAPAPLFRGYAHRRPRPRAPAPAPSPFVGGYGATMPPAPAPAPFAGYGHRRPRPRPRPRPRAPAPSRRPRGAPSPSPFAGYGSARRARGPAPSPSGGYGHRRPHAPAPSYGPVRPPQPSAYASVVGADEHETA